MFMLSLIICDDSPEVVESLQQMVGANISHHTTYRIDTFFSSEKLVKAVKKGLQPDIVLLDIKIGEESGIQLAKELFPCGSHTQVIFITGYMEYCTAVYETEHIYFLLKPVNPQELQQALLKAVEHLNPGPEKQLTLRSRSAIQRIPFSAIRYIESKARKVIIHYGDTSYEHYSTLTSLLNQLPGNFIHCHKSFCINMDYVARMEVNRFILSSGKPIPISQAKRAKTRDLFLSYLNQII